MPENDKFETAIVAFCPHCLEDMNICTGDGAPSPTDFALCAFCGEFNVFDANMKLRKPSLDDIERLKSFENYQEMLCLQLAIYATLS